MWQVTLRLLQLSGLEKPAPHSTELLLYLHPTRHPPSILCTPVPHLDSPEPPNPPSLSPVFWRGGKAWPGSGWVWVSFLPPHQQPVDLLFLASVLGAGRPAGQPLLGAPEGAWQSEPRCDQAGLLSSLVLSFHIYT